MICNASGKAYATYNFFIDSVNQASKTTIYLLYAFEVAMIVTSIFATIGVLALSAKFNVWHRNMQVLFVFQFLLHFPTHFLRLFDIYEDFMGLAGRCRLHQILLSFIKVTVVLCYGHCPLALLLERTFVFKFLRDYERSRRYYIPVLLIAVIITISSVFAYLLVTNVLNVFVFLGYMSGLTFVTVTLYFVLMIVNKRKLKQFPRTVYSLGKRFQLVENQRVLKLVRTIFFCFALVGIFISSFLLIVIFNRNNVIVDVVFEICCSGSLLIHELAAAFTIDKWRTFIWVNLLGQKRKTVPVDEEQKRKEEEQAYFENLYEAWNSPKSA